MGSMNQPKPLAVGSTSIVPPIGRPSESYLVTTASASCPLARESVSWRLMSKGVVGARRVFQRVCAVLLIVVIDSGVKVWMLRSC